jgi:hypothetical protein
VLVVLSCVSTGELDCLLLIAYCVFLAFVLRSASVGRRGRKVTGTYRRTDGFDYDVIFSILLASLRPAAQEPHNETRPDEGSNVLFITMQT